MPNLIVPRYLCLDTSTIGKLAKAAASDHAKSSNLAIQIRQEIQNRGWLLVFTLEHLLEIAQHDDIGVVNQRLAYLREFEMLASIRSFDGSSRPGSFLDVDSFEIAAVTESTEKLSLSEIVKRVRDQIFVVKASKELLGGTQDEIELLCDNARPLRDKSQVVTSISRTDPAAVKQVKLKDVVDFEIQDGVSRRATVGDEAIKMTTELTETGDHRLTNHEEISQRFYLGVLKLLGGLEGEVQIKNGNDLIERLREKFDLPKELISLEMTVGELSSLINFSLNLRIYSRCHGRKLTLRDVTPEELPSWSFRQKLEECQQRAVRVEGNNSIDRKLAVMALYADACEVDKRTLEYISQIRRKWSGPAPSASNVFRVRNIEELLPLIE